MNGTNLHINDEGNMPIEKRKRDVWDNDGVTMGTVQVSDKASDTRGNKAETNIETIQGGY
jgi:hypothetical protein